MDFSIETKQVDASVALKAYALYKQRAYREAIPVLQRILDEEPSNMQARLFLAACFFYTSQPFAAVRVFRFIYDNCADAAMKQKACLAMQLVTGTMQNNAIPGEFGRVVERPKDAAKQLEAMLA